MRLLSILQQAFWPGYIISEPDFDTHPRCKSSTAVSICRTPGQQRARRAAEPPSSLSKSDFAGSQRVAVKSKRGYPSCQPMPQVCVSMLEGKRAPDASQGARWGEPHVACQPDPENQPNFCGRLGYHTVIILDVPSWALTPQAQRRRKDRRLELWSRNALQRGSFDTKARLVWPS